ncbi:hypothetical protein CN446_14800 [Bacillus cereus]|nr:hypothetical protein CN446_14800 [Bacillus cereus]
MTRSNYMKDYDITLDSIINKDTFLNITLSQGDMSSGVFNVAIKQRGNAFPLAGKKVYIVMVKPDKTVVFDELEVVDPDGGRAKLTLDSQVYTASGAVQAELFVMNGKNREVTNRFTFRVRDTFIDDLETSVDAFRPLDKLFEAIDSMGSIDFEELKELDFNTLLRDEDLGEYAKKEEIPDVSEFITKEDIPEVDLTDYAKHEDVKKVSETSKENSNQIGNLSKDVIDNKKGLIQSSKRDVNLNAVKRNIPLVSFVDDDGNPAILTKLKPLSVKYKVPFTICVPSDFIPAGTSLNAKQLRDLQDNFGFEVASHAKTHTPMNDTMPIEQQFIEVYESWRAMREMGLNIETMVYPYGQSTSFIREIVSRFYKAACSTDVILNNTPLRTYGLGRIEFPTAGWTIDNYKAKVDEAITNKSWLIFMLHCGQAQHDANAQQILDQLIQYIQSVKVDIVNVTDGVDISGNIIDINQQKHYYAKDGKNNIVNCIPMLLNPTTGKETITADTIPSSLENNKFYFGIIMSSAETAKMPYNGAGVLTAIKSNDGFCYEHYYVGSRIFYRESADNSTWRSWKRLLTSEGKKTANITVTIPANGTAVGYVTGLTDYTFNKMIVLNPQFTINNGLMYSYSLDGTNGRIKINFQNTTATEIVLTNSVWQYVLMDF